MSITKENMIEKIELTKVLKEKLEKATTLEEMVLMFKEEGIEITKAQLEEIGGRFMGDTLDENDLDSVAGGVVSVGLYGFVWRHGVYIARLVNKCRAKW